MSRLSKEEIMERLQEKLKKGGKIFGMTCSAGIIANIASRANVDFLLIHKESVFGIDGRVPAFARAGYGESCNVVVMKEGPAVIEHSGSVPVIAGMGAFEPYENIDTVVNRMLDAGFSGITHFPTAGGWVGHYGECIKGGCVGYREELLELGNWSRKGIFTIGYIFDVSQIEMLKGADPSVAAVYVPRTEEESQWWEAAGSMEEALAKAAGLCLAVREACPDTIVLCCGGTFHSAGDIAKCIEETGADGYIGDELVEAEKSFEAVKSAITEYRETLRLQ